MEQGRLLPESYVNPTLPRYVAWPVVAVQSRLAEAGLLPGNLGHPLLAMRVVSALAGAAAVLVFALGGQLRAAALLAVCPAAVNLSHFAIPEPFLLLGVAATLLLAVRHAEGQAPAWAVGLALGLTASTKYTAAALVLPALLAAGWPRTPAPATRRQAALPLGAAGLALLASALLFAHGDALAARLKLPDARLLHPEYALGFVRGLARAALGAGVAAAALGGAVLAGRWPRPVAAPFVVLGAAALAFLAGTPGALLEPLRFLSDLAYNHQTRFEYKGLVAGGSAYLPYLRLLALGVGPLTLAAALAGALPVLRRLPAHGLLPLLLAVVAYLMVASSAHVALRFLVPALPAVAWLAAAGLDLLPARPRRLATALVLAAAGVASLLVVRLYFVDSRARAARWMEQNVPVGATVDVIANDLGYAPSAPPGRLLRQNRTLSREMAPSEAFQRAALAQISEGSGWLVLTAAYYQRYLEHPEQQPERTAYFVGLLRGRAGYEVAARFRQPWWLRPEAEFLDPEIVVLRKAAQPPTR
jgi:4-amino-4-deoxy-L-arabinose transferase-like glycosyltransferase